MYDKILSFLSTISLTLENGLQFLSRPTIKTTLNNTTIQGCNYISYFNRSLHAKSLIIGVNNTENATFTFPSQYQLSLGTAPPPQLLITVAEVANDTGDVTTNSFSDVYTFPKITLQYRVSGLQIVCAFLFKEEFFFSNATTVYDKPSKYCSTSF